MRDTTFLDGSGVEDWASLLISRASSLCTTDVNLASFSKLTICIPPLLVEVMVVGCLSTLTGSHYRVFCSISSNEFPSIIRHFTSACSITKGRNYFGSLSPHIRFESKGSFHIRNEDSQTKDP